MKYQCIEQCKQAFPVVVMCRVLNVSESGSDAWRKRLESRHTQEDARLTTSIQDVFVAFRGVYGSPRIHAELRDQGWRTSRKRVTRLMQENGMNARRKPFHPITTRSNPRHAVAPNVLQQDLTAERPNEKWTGDITSIPTAQGWLYLAVILDVFSRRVVGWAMSARCDELFVETALRMALARRQPGTGLLHHSDRGNHYTSRAYQQVLEEVEMTVSLSGKGNCYDNAVTASFFGTVKDECVHRTVYRSHDEARQSLFEYLEIFYNRQRRRSSLGSLSPATFEQQWELRAKNLAVF